MLVRTVTVGVAFAAAVAIGASCGASDDVRRVTSSRNAAGASVHDCLRAWNATENAESRVRIATGAYGAAIVTVLDHEVDGVPAGKSETAKSDGCVFLFHSSDRYISLSGSWADGQLVWDHDSTVTGRWSGEPRQWARRPLLATIADDGRLVTRSARRYEIEVATSK